MKRKIITILCIIGIWQVMALMIHKEVILPLPLYVFERMFVLASTSLFYDVILSTLYRVVISFIIAFLLGTMLGILSGLYQSVKDYLNPIISFLQAVPQIAYILILLVWFQSTVALIIIILLMILPVFYYNAMQGIESIQNEYLDIMKVYYQSLTYHLLHVYIPLMKGYLISAIQTCLPLALKVGVMAEIFVSSKQGIGKQLYFARIQIDMISIFAWVLWMVVIIGFITFVFNKLFKKQDF